MKSEGDQQTDEGGRLKGFVLWCVGEHTALECVFACASVSSPPLVLPVCVCVCVCDCLLTYLQVCALLSVCVHAHGCEGRQGVGMNQTFLEEDTDHAYLLKPQPLSLPLSLSLFVTLLICMFNTHQRAD